MKVTLEVFKIAASQFFYPPRAQTRQATAAPRRAPVLSPGALSVAARCGRRFPGSQGRMSDGAYNFAPPGTSSAQGLANRCTRFSWQAEPLQIEGAKLYAPSGILPWEPGNLLPPFAPTGEAAFDAQQPPPQVLASGRVVGRPKGAAKCESCRKKRLDCGLSCPKRPGVQPVAQIATPAQLPAYAAPAVPLPSQASAGAARGGEAGTPADAPQQARAYVA